MEHLKHLLNLLKNTSWESIPWINTIINPSIYSLVIIIAALLFKYYIFKKSLLLKTNAINTLNKKGNMSYISIDEKGKIEAYYHKNKKVNKK